MAIPAQCQPPGKPVEPGVFRGRRALVYAFGVHVQRNVVGIAARIGKNVLMRTREFHSRGMFGNSLSALSAVQCRLPLALFLRILLRCNILTVAYPGAGSIQSPLRLPDTWLHGQLFT